MRLEEGLHLVMSGGGGFDLTDTFDCNAFLPARFSMDFFKQYMTPGGVICIDEKLQGGETEALIGFCKDNGLEFRKDAGPFAMPAYARVR